jgi:hypothetical protein
MVVGQPHAPAVLPPGKRSGTLCAGGFRLQRIRVFRDVTLVELVVTDVSEDTCPHIQAPSSTRSPFYLEMFGNQCSYTASLARRSSGSHRRVTPIFASRDGEKPRMLFASLWLL